MKEMTLSPTLFFSFLFSRNKPVKNIKNQVSVYCSYRERMGHDPDRHWIKLFLEHMEKDDIHDVTDYDCNKFLDYVREKNHGSYALNQAGRAISNIRKYYKARGNNFRREY